MLVNAKACSPVTFSRINRRNRFWWNSIWLEPWEKTCNSFVNTIHGIRMSTHPRRTSLHIIYTGLALIYSRPSRVTQLGRQCSRTSRYWCSRQESLNVKRKTTNVNCKKKNISKIYLEECYVCAYSIYSGRSAVCHMWLRQKGKVGTNANW